jgi:hypothetical protein
MEASYFITQKDNEYRVLLTSGDIHNGIVEMLKEDIRDVSGK